MRKVMIILVLALCGLSATVGAESTINCHCFKDRRFDQQNPEKVVPYLLATTQNSFLAVAFATPKFNLVKDLMSGVSSDQLWISHYFAARFDRDRKSLLLLRREKGSWRDSLQEAGIPVNKLAPAVIAALDSTADRQLAAAVVDEALLDLLRVDPGQLQQMRALGADNREIILGFFLAERTGQKSTEIYRSVTAGATNWGTLAFVNNVQIGEMEQEFKRLLN